MGGLGHDVVGGGPHQSVHQQQGGGRWALPCPRYTFPSFLLLLIVYSILCCLHSQHTGGRLLYVIVVATAVVTEAFAAVHWLKWLLLLLLLKLSDVVVLLLLKHFNVVMLFLLELSVVALLLLFRTVFCSYRLPLLLLHEVWCCASIAAPNQLLLTSDLLSSFVSSWADFIVKWIVEGAAGPGCTLYTVQSSKL